MKRLLLALCLATSPSACDDALGPSDFYGNWGAENVHLTLSLTVARFETPCWIGDLAMPLLVDGKEFTAVATISWRGGAGQPDTRIVNFSGHKSGDRLELSVAPASLGLGPYSLRQGAQGTIVGCP